MDSISNNEYAPAGSQTHLGGASYISSRDILNRFANLSNQDRPNSKSPNNGNNAVTTCAGIYSALLGSHQQQQSVINDASSFTSLSRHLSEPPTVANQHSPVDDQMDCADRSCRTSPSASMKSFTRQPTSSSPPLRPLDPFSTSNSSSHINNGNNINNNNGSGGLDRPPPQLQPQSAVFSITQSGLQELLRKSGSIISTEEIKKANNASQLYLLVPSNYPVLMAVGADHEKAATVAAAAVNEATARNLLERFQLTTTSSSTLPSQLQQQQPQTIPSPVEQPNQSQNQVQPPVLLRAPRKNSTNIPPMLLQTLKDVVPTLAFRDILENTNNKSSNVGVPQTCIGSGLNPPSNNTPLPHLSSLAMACGFPSTVSELSQLATNNPAVTTTAISDERKKKKPPLADPTGAVAAAAASLLIPPQSNMEATAAEVAANGGGGGGGGGPGPGFFLEDYRSTSGGEVKIKPPPPSVSSISTGQGSVDAASGGGLCSDGLMNTSDSNGSLFFSTNDSPPARNYMGRMGGGGAAGSAQGNQSGSDSKDIRRRVSHNEVERRRRDRINTWIAELYKLLPPEQQAKSQYQSKGVVLKRVCEYFQSYDSNLKALQEENAIFKQEVCRLTRENHILRNSLNAHFQQQHNNATVTSSSAASTSATSAVTAAAVSCEDSKAPSPSKRSHYSAE